MEKIPFKPEGHPAIMPSLSFHGTEKALIWYKNVFGAKERTKMEGPDKKIIHAELVINDSVIYLAEANPGYNSISPKETNGNSIKLYAYVEDVDGTIKRAVQDGATLVMPAQDMFYGDRVGCIDDPFGYTWVLATHIKDVPEKEMMKVTEDMLHNS